MTVRIRTRRGTASQWTTANPVLASGEAGYETDTRKLKYGNGIDAWNSLPYFSSFTRSIQTITSHNATVGSDSNTDYVSYLNITPVDPNLNSTTTILTFDSESSPYLDGSPVAATWTGTNTTVSGASKYGPGALSFNGSSSSLATSASNVFNWGAGAYTLEFWFNPSNVSGTKALFCSLYGWVGSAEPTIFLEGDKVNFYFQAGGAYIVGSTTIVANQWHHFALCRSGTSTRMFINGVQNGSTWSDSNSYQNTQPHFGWSYWGGGGQARWYSGLIDEIRVTKAARYTSNFTPVSVYGSFSNTYLPTAVGNFNRYTFKQVGLGGMVTASSSQTILDFRGNQITFVPMAKGESIEVVSDGTNWQQI